MTEKTNRASYNAVDGADAVFWAVYRAVEGAVVDEPVLQDFGRMERTEADA
jgi:hypothetical protein